MRNLAAALAVTVALCLAGCGDDEPGDDQDSAKPPASPSGTALPSATADPGAAAGEAIVDPLYRFNAPEGWARSERDPEAEDPAVLVVSSADPDLLDRITVETWTTVNFTDVAAPSDDVVEYFRSWAEGGRQVGVVDWAGQRAYHFVGDDPVFGHLEWFGVLWQGKHVLVQFLLEKATPAQATKLIDSIEASWEWTGPAS